MGRLTKEALAMDRLNPTLGGVLRDQAVENVDRRHGYTMEFAPSPSQHREEYDAEERALIADVMVNDPGRVICNHERRDHNLGAGQKVCFECYARMLFGGVR